MKHILLAAALVTSSAAFAQMADPQAPVMQPGTTPPSPEGGDPMQSTDGMGTGAPQPGAMDPAQAPTMTDQQRSRQGMTDRDAAQTTTTTTTTTTRDQTRTGTTTPASEPTMGTGMGGSGGMAMAGGTDPSVYPMCSRTVTDRCMQREGRPRARR